MAARGPRSGMWPYRPDGLWTTEQPFIRSTPRCWRRPRRFRSPGQHQTRASTPTDHRRRRLQQRQQQRHGIPVYPERGKRLWRPAARRTRSLAFLTPATSFARRGPGCSRGLIGNLRIAQQNPAFDAMDMETAAAQAVADAHSVPFLGIRGISDGPVTRFISRVFRFRSFTTRGSQRTTPPERLLPS